MSFVKVSKQQFTDWANKQFKTWEYKLPIRGKELIIVSPDPAYYGMEYHIYTTLTQEAGSTRDIGKDAIRITLFDVKSASPVAKTKKVLRTEGATTIWTRIEERLDELRRLASSQKYCPKCNAHMVERENKKTFQKFYGCSGYPACPDTSTAKSRYPFKSTNVTNANTAKPQSSFEIAKKQLAKILGDEPVDDPMMFNTKGSTTELVAEEENVPTTAYPHASFPFPTFNRVQSTIMKKGYWDKDINLVLGTTTSSGKTVSAELFMAHTLKEGKKVIYVSPLKSLTQEKYDEWSIRYKQYRIMILTGDYVLTDARARELNSADLICLTSEMIDSRTRNYQSEKSEWLFSVGLVIVDESHIISTNRGHAVEAGLMRFSKLVSNAKILCLSATMPNVEDFKSWLTNLNNKHTEVINSGWRPTKLTWHFIPHMTYGNYYEIQDDKRKKVLEILAAKPKEKFLVFVHDKNTGRILERMIRGAGIDTKFHNADLNLDDRMEIEKSFSDKENGLRVIVSTSTLAWGRSLPARNVIIVGIHRGINEVDELDIIQMAGRAGRLGIDPEGDCYFICDSISRWKNTIANPRKVESTLLNKSILGFHILAEIKNNVVYDRKTLELWFERSLAKLQLPIREDLLDSTFTELQKWGMLINQEGIYKITRLGRVSATLYYFPKDIFHWSKLFSILNENDLWESDLALAYALGTTPSLSLGYVPKTEVDRVEEFVSHVAGIWPEPRHTLKHSIVATDLFDLLSQGEKPILLRNLQNDAARITQALQWIDGIRQWGQNSFWNALPIRIQYGIGRELVELCTLPGIGAVRAKKLHAEGLSTIRDVVHHPEIVSKLMGKNLASSVMKAANALVRIAK